MKNNQSFSSKIMLLFFLSVVIPLIIISIILSSSFKRILISRDKKSFENVLTLASSNIEVYLDELERLTLTPYTYTEVFKAMEFINRGLFDRDDYVGSHTVNSEYSSTINKLVNSSRKDILGVVFIPYNDTENMYVVGRYYNNISKVSTPNYYSKWLEQCLVADGKTFSTPVHRADYYKASKDFTVFSTMRLIKDIDTKRIIGFIKVDVQENIIKYIIDNVQTSPYSTLLLMDQNFQVIYSPTSVPENIEISIKNGDSVFSSPSDIYQITTKPIKNTDWLLVYLSSNIDIARINEFIFKTMIVIIGLYTIFTVVLFRLNVVNVIKSMNSITNTMKQVENGNLTARAISNDNNDMDYIADSLNHMIKNLDSHIKSEREAIIKEKNAQYLALQSQINPHFLCNTLNGFIGLNRLGEKQLLEESLLQLSGLYRYTCSSGNVTNVEEEFSFLEKYLTLQKLRFDEILMYQLIIDENSKQIELPKLILQPLVENSIKYGFNTSDGVINISIESKLLTTDNCIPTLLIIVSDTGPGFNTENINDNSTGLKNIRERLSIYNNHSTLSIKSNATEGTTCIIKIPLKEDSYECNNL